MSVAMADKNVSSSSCDDWKMTRYIPGISINRFCSFLAWTGLVSSVIFIVVSLNLLFIPLALGFHDVISYEAGRMSAYSTDRRRHYLIICGIFYGLGSTILVINIGMFLYSFKLWKAINSDNMKEMRSLIKIGCYVVGSFEMLTTIAAGVIPPIIIIIYELKFSYRPSGFFINFMLIILSILIIISVVVIAMTSLMIHGVRKFKPGLVNIYIIFKIVLFTLFALGTLVQVIMGWIFPMFGPLGWLLGINQFLFCGFFYFYGTGFMVVQYNIMLGRQI